jgi:hypothetical protein
MEPNQYDPFDMEAEYARERGAHSDGYSTDTAPAG